MLEIVGWEHARELLPSLVFGVVWGTREDRLPYMRRFQSLLRDVEPELESLFAKQRVAPPGVEFDADDFFRTVVDGRLEAGFGAVLGALRSGVPYARIVDELSAAAAERLVRFDARIDADPRREEGWLDVTHVLTFANAVRSAYEMRPSPELLRGLFYAARFVHYVRNLDASSDARWCVPGPASDDGDAEELLARIDEASRCAAVDRLVALALAYFEAGHDPEAFRAWLTRYAIADSAYVDIWLAHTIKVSVAALEERAKSQSPRRDLALVAALRFLVSPKAERGVVQAAVLAEEFVRRGR
jgi:hypothetical protein